MLIHVTLDVDTDSAGTFVKNCELWSVVEEASHLQKMATKQKNLNKKTKCVTNKKFKCFIVINHMFWKAGLPTLNTCSQGFLSRKKGSGTHTSFENA